MRILNNGKEDGFTLVEILVVIAITAFVGTIMVMIFINTLRGSNKSKILANMKQNGQAILENMDKTIRDAGNVVCTSGEGGVTTNSSEGNTLVIYWVGLYTRFRLQLQTGSANGSVAQDFMTQPSAGTLSDFVAGVCQYPNYAQTPLQVLTDTNWQTGVSVQNIPSTYLFKVNRQAGSKDTVTISFQLAPAAGLPDSIRSQIDPIPFQTTVQLR